MPNPSRKIVLTCGATNVNVEASYFLKDLFDLVLQYTRGVPKVLNLMGEYVEGGGGVNKQ